jgi:hypothetical protein
VEQPFRQLAFGHRLRALVPSLRAYSRSGSSQVEVVMRSEVSRGLAMATSPCATSILLSRPQGVRSPAPATCLTYDSRSAPNGPRGLCLRSAAASARAPAGVVEGPTPECRDVPA